MEHATISKNQSGKEAETSSAKPIGIEMRSDRGAAESNTKIQTMERTKDSHSSNFGQKLHGFFFGESGTSAIQTVGLVALTTFMGAMTGLMTIGYFAAMISGAVLGAEFGWYIARHPKGE